MSHILRVLIFSVGVGMLMGGCVGQNDFEDLQGFVQEIKNSKKGTIPPPPTFAPYDFYTYSASSLRSPFVKPKTLAQLISESESKKQDEQALSNSHIKPDANRVKEYLEQFTIENMSMVGTLENVQGIWALVLDEKGDVHRIQVGDYLGRNHGRVASITTVRIGVVEIVPDGVGGWLERPREITLSGVEDNV